MQNWTLMAVSLVVLLAGCGRDIIGAKLEPWGRFLSIYDESDTIAGSCQAMMDTAKTAAAFKELKLQVGLGHGVLFKPLKEWVDPAAAWALAE